MRLKDAAAVMLTFFITMYSLLHFKHRDSRKLLDSSDVRRCFGPVVIEYGKVQSKVMLKFDNWHKEVLNSFGKLLNEQMIGFHREIAKVCVKNFYLMKSQV